MVQLGYPLKDHGTVQTEVFHLPILKEHRLFDGIKDPMVMRRNHQWYVRSSTVRKQLLASYKDQAMIVLTKNAVLIQFHPEKSVDGKKLLLNWLQSF